MQARYSAGKTRTHSTRRVRASACNPRAFLSVESRQLQPGHCSQQSIDIPSKPNLCMHTHCVIWPRFERGGRDEASHLRLGSPRDCARVSCEPVAVQRPTGERRVRISRSSHRGYAISGSPPRRPFLRRTQACSGQTWAARLRDSKWQALPRRPCWQATSPDGGRIKRFDVQLLVECALPRHVCFRSRESIQG